MLKYTLQSLKHLVNSINRNIKNEEFEDLPEVKKYFSKIYNVVPKEIREKLKKLNIPKEKKKS